MQHREERASRHIGCLLHKGGPEKDDDDKVEVLAAMCHSGDPHSTISANREDDKHYKQLSQ